MQSLFEESMPSHEISSRTMVSLTLVLVKKRLVDVAPMAFKFFRALIPLEASECLIILNSPIVDPLLRDDRVCLVLSY